MFCVLDWGGGSRGATSAKAISVVLRKKPHRLSRGVHEHGNLGQTTPALSWCSGCKKALCDPQASSSLMCCDLRVLSRPCFRSGVRPCPVFSVRADRVGLCSEEKAEMTYESGDEKLDVLRGVIEGPKERTSLPDTAWHGIRA